MASPTKKTLRDAIRGSVPGGKLKAAKIILTDTPGEVIGGYTEFAPKVGVIKIGAPAGMKAADITIRGHETRHATHHGKRPQRKKMTAREAVVSQIIDDVNIESKPLPKGARGLTEYSRAHLTTAMKDINRMKREALKVKAGKAKDGPERRNADLTCATRALSMLKSYASTLDPDIPPKLLKARRHGVRELREILGSDSLRAIYKVVEVAKRRNKRATAISMLLALMEPEEPEEGEDDEETKGDPTDILAPVKHGDSLEGKMTIVDLRPKSVFCAKEKSITVKHAPSGVIINPTRFLSAITTGDANGLFSRRVRQKPGGTVVIDASGSMSATKKNLAALCALVPTATVAYYSGNEHAKGVLAVYAYEGKRFNGELPSNTLRGGNSVDLAAIKWLMRHGKPWTFVSDLEFCGGPLGSEVIARALIERAVRRGDCELHTSLQAAYEHFGGKGELRMY